MYRTRRWSQHACVRGAEELAFFIYFSSPAYPNKNKITEPRPPSETSVRPVPTPVTQPDVFNWFVETKITAIDIGVSDTGLTITMGKGEIPPSPTTH